MALALAPRWTNADGEGEERGKASRRVEDSTLFGKGQQKQRPKFDAGCEAEEKRIRPAPIRISEREIGAIQTNNSFHLCCSFEPYQLSKPECSRRAFEPSGSLHVFATLKKSNVKDEPRPQPARRVHR